MTDLFSTRISLFKQTTRLLQRKSRDLLTSVLFSTRLPDSNKSMLSYLVTNLLGVSVRSPLFI